MTTFYPLQPNSLETTLSGAVDADDVVIPVVDADLLPAAPNTVVIGDDELCETILYTGKSGDDLTGVTRGYDDSGVSDGSGGTYGGARSWASGSTVCRNITAKDINDLQDAVEARKIPFWKYDDSSSYISMADSGNTIPFWNYVGTQMNIPGAA